MMSRNEQLKSLVADLEDDIVKFYEKGNKTAGTRARKKLQDIKNLSQEIRLEIQDFKNSGKV
ncbi:MAG: histone H1 [Balneolaceae bacterium]